jgi:hypothetical protein
MNEKRKQQGYDKQQLDDNWEGMDDRARKQLLALSAVLRGDHPREQRGASKPATTGAVIPLHRGG